MDKIALLKHKQQEALKKVVALSALKHNIKKVNLQRVSVSSYCSMKALLKKPGCLSRIAAVTLVWKRKSTSVMVWSQVMAQ